MNGFLVIDKPAGPTSRDIVNRAQQWFPRRTKIGHTGTLDPLATGVLVLCIGEATKFAERVQAMLKQYKTRIRLGATSSTDDADGEIVETMEPPIPTRDRVQELLPAFLGTVSQLPPQVSALKIQGQRAYDLVRKGQTVELQSRLVRIDAVELNHYEWPWLDLTIDCGKGTYIRSMARDLGQQLAVGGLVQTLRRTRVGPFHVENGISPNVDFTAARAALLPISMIANI